MSGIEDILSNYGLGQAESEKAKSVSITEPPEPEDDLTRRYKQEDAVLNAFALAAKTNPEQYAKLKKQAVESGLDPEMVDKFPEEAERRRRYTEAVRLVQESPKTARWVANPENARVGSDNVENLSQIETAIRSIKRGWTTALRGFDTTQIEDAVHVLGIIDRIEKGEFKDFGELKRATPYADLFKDARKDTLERWKARFQAQLAENLPEYNRRKAELEKLQPSRAVSKFYEAEGFGASVGALFEAPGEVSLNIALESAGLFGPTTPAMIGGGLVAGARGLSVAVGMSSYQAEYAGAISEAIEKRGIDMNDTEALKAFIASPEFLEEKRKATIKAATIGAFDVATARVAGVSLGKSKLGNLAKQTGVQMAGGGAGEAAGSVLSGQDVRASSVLAEMIGEIPGAAVDVGTMAGKRAVDGYLKADAAEETAQAVEQINQLAASDKLLQRDADTFQEFVAQAAEDGPVDTVYVSGRMLMQSGLSAPLAEVSPAVRSQLDQSILTGTDIAIPVEEYTARIAPTPQATQLLDHVKFEPDDFTRAEAREFMEKQGEALKEEVERLMKGREDADAFAVSRETVKEDIRKQLEKTGRFRPEVNETYAVVASQYFAVRAAQTGVMPDEFYRQRGLKIQAEAVGGKMLSQLQSDHEIPTEQPAHRVIDGAELTALRREAAGVEAPERGITFHVTQEGQAIVTGPARIRVPDRFKAFAQKHDLKLVVRRGGTPQAAMPVEYRESGALYAGEIGKPGIDRTGKTLFQSDPNKPPRGGFDPETNTIALLKAADLSSFLHEGAHFFFESDLALAAQLVDEAKQFGYESLKPGEKQIIEDVSALLKWHGIQGPIEEQLQTWYTMDFEEQRSHHERTAESFEAYLFSGKAPSLELQPLFQRMRAWFVNVYKSLKAFLEGHPEAGKLNDEVRGVFDRMIATQEEIAIAEQARSMFPMFSSPEQTGMTPEAFADYQAQGKAATGEAIQDMQAKGLRDMQWLSKAKGRQVKRLQRESKGLRAEVEIEARREIMSQPVYRAWQFLTQKLEQADQLPEPERKSDPNTVDPTTDSLFVAIAKLGGIKKDQVLSEWGIDPKNKPESGLFGKPVWRLEDGLTLDGMAEALSQHGYLPLDSQGRYDLNDLYERFVAELAGDEQHSDYWSPQEFMPGDQVANPEGLGAGRLDIGALAEMMQNDKAIVERLKSLRMTAENGLHPDIAASIIGFDSGDEMVREIAAAQPPKEAITELTDRLMLERHGELATPEAIELAAEAAIHNEARARFVTTEYNALAKALGEKEQTGTDKRGRPIMRQILPRVAKEYAAQIIAGLRVRDVKPSLYANAAERAAKASQKAMNKGNLTEAAAEKRNQVLNIYATRAAYDAQDEVKAIIQHFKSLQKPFVQKAMRGDYLVQLNALLARFDFRQKTSHEKIPLADWIDQEADRLAAVLPNLPSWVLDESFVKPYRDMTVEELRGLNDALRQVEHMARREQKMYMAVRNQNYQQEVASILAELQKTSPEVFDGADPIEYRKDAIPLIKELAGRFTSKFDAEFLNIENLLDVISKGKGKALFESLFSRLSHAQDERTQFMHELGKFVNEYTKAYTTKERLEMAFTKHKVPGTALYLTREQRIAVALFNGSEEGRQRLADGNKYSQATIQAIVNSLDAKDVALVKAIWQVSEEKVWPRLKEVNERTAGIAPPKVQAMPFSHATLGELTGGYVPLVYDGDMDSRALDLNTNASVQELLGGTATVAATSRSASKARLQKVKRPLDLSLRAMAYKINETVHDITHREAVADTYRLLQSRRISNAIRMIAGPDVYNSLVTHVREIAVKPHAPNGFSEKFFWYLRKNTLINMMGASFNTIAINVLGVSPLVRRVGAVNYIRHLNGLTPAKYRWILEKSLYMRERLLSFDRDMHEELSRLSGATHLVPSIGFWFKGLSVMDRTVTMPGWLAAYERGMKENNNDEAAAVEFADRVIRQTQGSGRVVDLAKIAGGVGPAGEFKRIITMFYNFFNAQLGQIVRGRAIAGKQWSEGQRIKAAANLTLDVLAVIVIPATLEALARGNCGEEDGEDYLYCAARSSTLFTASFFPILRDVLPYTWRQFDPDFVGGFGVRLSPVENALETMARLPKATSDIARDEETETDEKTVVRGLGYLLGLPGFQAWRTLDGYRALQEGETDNPAVLLTGPPREQR